MRATAAGRVLKNDYLSLLMLMVVGVAWVFFIVAMIFGRLPTKQGRRMTLSV